MKTLQIGKLTKSQLLIWLISISLFYGLIMVNYIDLTVSGSSAWGYHLWLTAMYFMPFISIFAFEGLRNWELVASLGFLTSLMNDLFWLPMYRLIGGGTWIPNISLAEWYRWQLGFGDNLTWTFNGGFISFQVTSWMMGLAIYVRIIIVILLLYRWWTIE